MSAGEGTYDKQGKQHLSSSEMKQANNVPLSSWQTRMQSEKRRVPSPQHKQQGNSLNKCNFKLFLWTGRESVSNVHPVYVFSVWHLEFKLPRVLVQPVNKTWKPKILHLVCIMHILFLEVLITAIQMMLVLLIVLKAFYVFFIASGSHKLLNFHN